MTNRNLRPSQRSSWHDQDVTDTTAFWRMGRRCVKRRGRRQALGGMRGYGRCGFCPGRGQPFPHGASPGLCGSGTTWIGGWAETRRRIRLLASFLLNTGSHRVYFSVTLQPWSKWLARKEPGPRGWPTAFSPLGNGSSMRAGPIQGPRCHPTHSTWTRVDFEGLEERGGDGWKESWGSTDREVRADQVRGFWRSMALADP